MKLGIWLKLAGGTAAVVAVSIAACDHTLPASPTSPGVTTPGEPPSSAPPVGITPIGGPEIVLAGAGDIAVCGSDGAEQTARLLDRLPGFVFTLGDNVYPSSTSELLKRCYEPAWGRHRHRTYASPGNHDWEVEAGAPYFTYFGAAAGPPGTGYYSVDLGSWHVLSLNSNIAAQPGSSQYDWARRDIGASSAVCTLALWHHPVFSSGRYGNDPRMKPIWQLLDAAEVDLVITAHEHSYERFAPQNADGRLHPRGLRQFVVGTGGADLRSFASAQPNSETRIAGQWGVLRLQLRAGGYEWEFMPAEGSARDGGAAECVK
jgi:3',5'-cyclic AMP phosphodiesterase CpdA